MAETALASKASTSQEGGETGRQTPAPATVASPSSPVTASLGCMPFARKRRRKRNTTHKASPPQEQALPSSSSSSFFLTRMIHRRQKHKPKPSSSIPKQLSEQQLSTAVPSPELTPQNQSQLPAPPPLPAPPAVAPTCSKPPTGPIPEERSGPDPLSMSRRVMPKKLPSLPELSAALQQSGGVLSMSLRGGPNGDDMNASISKSAKSWVNARVLSWSAQDPAITPSPRRDAFDFALESPVGTLQQQQQPTRRVTRRSSSRAGGTVRRGMSRRMSLDELSVPADFTYVERESNPALPEGLLPMVANGLVRVAIDMKDEIMTPETWEVCLSILRVGTRTHKQTADVLFSILKALCGFVS